MVETGDIGTGRRIGARTLTVLGLVVALVGMVAFYLEQTVLDEGASETIARELIQNDEVREQVALTAVDELFQNVDVEQAIAQRLPEQQQALAPVLTGVARQGAEEAANRLLQRPRVQNAWVRTVTATQRQLVKLLEDKGALVSTTGGQVVLDLRPIMIDLGQEVVIIGRIAEQLPESSGKIAIVDSDELDTAQTLVRVLRFLADWLWIVALVLGAAAVWLARGRRREELRAIAVGMIAVGMLMLLVRRLAGDYLVDELTTDASQPAGTDVWRIVTQGLADRAWLWVVLGALALVGTWLVGPTGLADRARAAVAPVAAKPWWTYGIVVASIVVVAALVPLFQRGLAGLLVFVVALVAGVEVVRRTVLHDPAARSQ